MPDGYDVPLGELLAREQPTEPPLEPEDEFVPSPMFPEPGLERAVPRPSLEPSSPSRYSGLPERASYDVPLPPYEPEEPQRESDFEELKRRVGKKRVPSPFPGIELPFTYGDVGEVLPELWAALRHEKTYIDPSGKRQFFYEPSQPGDLLEAIGSFPPIQAGSIPVRAAGPLLAAGKLAAGALGQEVVGVGSKLGRVALEAGEAVGRAAEAVQPGPQVVRAGRKAKIPSEGSLFNHQNQPTQEEAALLPGFTELRDAYRTAQAKGFNAGLIASEDRTKFLIEGTFKGEFVELTGNAETLTRDLKALTESSGGTAELGLGPRVGRAAKATIRFTEDKTQARVIVGNWAYPTLDFGFHDPKTARKIAQLFNAGKETEALGLAKVRPAEFPPSSVREAAEEVVPPPLGLTSEELRAATQAGIPIPPGPEGAAKVREALLAPQIIGTRGPAGNIVGAQPVPRRPVPLPGRAPAPRPPKEYWARPLKNLEMIAGAFKDNFWRSAAQRTGLREFTSVINPAALVSGTATDPVSITGRALLLRNRVLDVGDSGVNAGMAWLRERPNPFSIGSDMRITSLPGKPTWDAVFESPSRFKLSSEQSEYVRIYQEMVDDGLALLRENGIEIKLLGLPADRHYIPRLVEAIRGIENEKAGRVGGRIGAKAGFQKTRFYEFAEEGVAKGVVYSNDPLTVMEHHVQSIYRLVADGRLAEEMAPLGETILERVEKKAPGLFAAREISKKEFTRARELLSAVNRAYRGERLPPALVASIGHSFPSEAAALKAAGPNSPALQPIEDAARLLMTGHRSTWKDLSLRMKRVKDAVQPGFHEGWIPQPFAQGRVFPKEVAEAVAKATGDTGNAWLRAVQVPSVISRTIGTTIDFGAPFVQGLGVLGENPGAWARATLKHYQAFLDPAAKQRYFTQNAEVVKEMAQYGANVGTSEFFAGNRPVSGLLKLLPEEGRNVTTWMGKQTVGRFQESFGTFLDVSAVEMWKAIRGRALQEGPDSLFALGDYVSHARGTMSQRTIGIGVSQQQIEGGLLMFAPRYTKAGFALFSDIATLPPYLKGNALRANLSAIIGSATTFFLAGAAALNALDLMKPEEVEERLNPIKNGRYNSKFLTLPVGTDNVGIGSFGYSMLRLIAGTTDKALNEPGDLLKLDAQDNPIMGFFRSRLVGGAPATSLGIELFTGRNYLGEKFDEPLDYAKAVGQRLLPFWAEAYLLQAPPASVESFPFAFGGQRVFPQSYGARAHKLEEQLAQERGWTLPLNRDQRRQLEAANPDLAKLKEQAEAQSEKFAKDEIQQQTADYYADLDNSKTLRERSLEVPYRGFLNGKLSGKGLLEIRGDASTEMAGAMALAREKFPKALIDRASRETYYQANRIEIKEGNPDDIAAEGYYSIRVPVTEEGKNLDAFYKARAEYLKRFTPEVQNYITKIYPNKRFTQDWMNKLEAEIQRDQEALRPYWGVRDQVKEQYPGAIPSFIERRISAQREQLRRSDKEVREALFRWGYTTRLFPASRGGPPQVPTAPTRLLVPAGVR